MDAGSGRRRFFASLAFLLVALGAMFPSATARAACTEGACVTVGPRATSISTTQSVLLNPLLQALLPGTGISLSVLDWNALAGADIDLNLLLTQLAADVGVSDPAEVLDADVQLGRLALVAADVLEADGNTAAASVLRSLGLQLGGLAGTIRLADILRLEFPPGALGNIRLDVLDLVTGWVQLYNYRNVVTTPEPITVDLADLGLAGIAGIELWAQVVEPPVHACGPTGTQFYSASIRLKLNVQVLNTDDTLLAPIISALNSLDIGLLALRVDRLGLGLLKLQLYVDVARAEGAITAVDALTSAVTLQARPGLVNLYIGQIDDGVFWNRNTVLTPGIVDPVDLTSLGLEVEVRLLSILGDGIPVAAVEGEIGITIKAAAEGSPELQTVVVTGPFPATATVSSGSVDLAYLVGSLLDDLELSASGSGLSLSLIGSPPIEVPVGFILDLILSTVTSLLEQVLSPLLQAVLELLLGNVVDVLLHLLGIHLGEMVITVEGIAQACTADLVLAKLLDPVDDPGRFDLAILRDGAVLASASAVGHEGRTATIETEPGATYALSEAAAGDTSLSSYATTWACTGDDGNVVASGDGTSFDLVAPAVSSEPLTLTCAFTNRLRQANLSIVKSDGSPVYVPGTTATYTITVGNDGPDAARGVTVSDTLPKGATLDAAWSCTATGGSCDSGSGGAPGDTEINVLIDLDAGGEAVIQVPVRFSADPADYQ